jgi:hypothetical protein
VRVLLPLEWLPLPKPELELRVDELLKDRLLPELKLWLLPELKL